MPNDYASNSLLQSGPRGGTGTDAGTRESQVTRSVMNLTAATDELLSSVVRLEERLSSVLRPESIPTRGNEKTAEIKPVAVELANALNSRVDLLHDTIQRVRSITDRLEV